MIVTKKHFATLLGRGPSAVSNWISDARLTATSGALVGEGASQRIHVAAACRELIGSLDLAQAQGNAAETLASAQDILDRIEAGEAIEPAAPAKPAAKEEDPREPAPMDPLKAERLIGERMANERRRRELEAQAGRWTLAEEAGRLAATQLRKELEMVEVWLSSAAEAVAADHSVEARAVRRTLRSAFRKHREDRARVLRKGADAEPMAIAAE